MQSPEYGEILTSLQEVVRKAYVLGRSEALKQVIDVMQKDETTWKPLALTGPGQSPDATNFEASSQPEVAAESTVGQPASPSWWNRPPGKARPARA